ncbi:MAG: glycerol-3-phosphate dehydrogenase/oxidase [Candidatus Sigynarchaeota archaeon]
MSKTVETLDFSNIGREKVLAKLRSDEFDLLIIGGGVTGAGIARDATMRGFNVALVDKNDFAFGTSSRSSKMAHGGVRYLNKGEFGLVKESEAERNWLRNDFPNLVRPLPIVVPSFEGEKLSKFLLKLVVFFYNLLDKGKNFKKAYIVKDLAKIKEMEPGLTTNGLLGFAVIYDTNVDDARLTIETIKEAIFTGKCVAANYVKVTRLEHDATTGKCCGAWVIDQEKQGGEFLVKAKIVVNATGIWTDDILQKKPAGYPPRVIRPTKGVHIIFKQEDVPINSGFGISSHIDGRFYFVLRRENHVVIGTTDTDYKDSPDDPVCTKEDAEYLLSTVRIKFPSAKADFDHIVGSYAGVRPLVAPRAKKGKEPSESAVSRDHEIIHADDDLLSICGGKLTTFRVMAEDIMLKEVLPLARKRIPGRRFDATKGIARKPYLIGMTRPEWDAHPLVKEFAGSGKLDGEQLAHLHRQYGKAAIPILEIAKDDAKLLERLVPSESTKYAPWILAEIKYTVLHDCPVHLVDILARRLEFQWMVHPSKQPAAARVVAALAGSLLGWDKTRQEKEVEDYIAYVMKNSFFISK